MKHLLPLLFFFTALKSHDAAAQSPRWQQQVDMQIKVQLNEKDNTLQATERFSYQNNSPDTLHYIWMHCWPNAYRNDKTAFSEQLLKNNQTDFYFSREEERGYMNQLQFTVDGSIATMEDHPEHQDIIKLILPQSLPPGKSVLISTPFHVKLPKIFSRMGHQKGFYAITQWYPKPAVYDKDGWHPMPYLDQGEFYSEFGKYEVSITAPANFVIASTGRCTDSSTYQSTNSNESLKTWVFKQNNIHDFAWFAGRDYFVAADTLLTAAGKTLQVRSFYPKADQELWQHSIQYIKTAIRYRNALVGEYPYDDVQVVDGFQGEGSGGMEYPTITVINKVKGQNELETTIAHEVGHNWFYGALASNERQEPWLDEGLNTYYDRRYEKEHFSNVKVTTGFLEKRMPGDIEKWLLSGLESIHSDQPIRTSADSFNQVNYALVSYYKTAIWLESLEKKLGRSLFDSCMKAYYQAYQFKHVYAEDIQQVFETVSGQPLPAFRQLNITGSVFPEKRKKIHPVFLFDFSGAAEQHMVGFGPLPGYNKYDGFMLGGFLHNYQLPLPRFRFFIAPMYGIASKSLAGFANLSYSFYPPGKLQQLEIGATAAKFTGDEYTVNEKTQKLHYQKLSPFIKLTAKEKDPLSKRERYIQFRSYFFTEDETAKKSIGRNLQQLTLYYANHRILYPYELNAILDATKDFTRLALTGKYYFNYADRQGGLQLRFFSGKFIYNGPKTLLKTLENDRYLLNLTGANGYEDYTYSNYFTGRNEFSGWMSQQIMTRDGGFKVRTDLKSDKIGKTDNWLTAVNLSTTIPNKYNPLALLPVRVPLKIFADFGTFAEAWENENESSRIVFDAGLQISLLYETVNIYIPILNSRVFREYNQSILGEKRFWKTISFSIDIQQFSTRKILAKAGL